MLSGVPYLLTLQEGDPIPYIMKKVRPVYPFFVRAFRRARVVQPISSYLATWAKGMGATCPIVVVPNAVDTKHFSQEYAEDELDEIKKELGKKDGEKYVITTSRLVTKNAVDIVIRAMKLLPEHVTFLVLGIGPDEEILKALAEKEGVASRVRFLGQRGHAELPKYLQVSDVFTRPSRSEGMGNSFVEAMAAGIPVVATAEGGIVDFLFEPEKNPDKEPTGLIAKTEDLVDTARQIARFLNDEALRARCVRNAKALVLARYDWSLIAKDMREKVFATLLNTPPQ
jgi:glycosyltransferase involved in cell wall biosynthesis